jgi:serine/threonine-protein kinase
LIGETLGNRYKLLRELGAGGMAWVYQAEDMTERSLVAVKVLYPQYNQDISYVERFLREARLALQISSQHVVRVLDYGADRDLHYLVMEQIRGKDLATILTDMGRLPCQEVLRIGIQVAQALEAANAQGVVHRDIKPENIMIDAQGLVKVLDFGIARARELPTVTEGGFVGSPSYISPEQAMGKQVDIRSDIYSLGIVLYEALSGKRPFVAETSWSIISQHIAQEPPKIDLAEDCWPRPPTIDFRRPASWVRHLKRSCRVPTRPSPRRTRIPCRNREPPTKTERASCC